MSDDWRFDGETGANAGDYFLGQRKRLDIDKRRPVIRRASDLVGPGIDAQAVRVTNWNDMLATFNGYYSSLPGAAYAPDSIQNFLGTVVMDSEMGGVQVLTGLANGREYKRLFLRNPGDETSITFGAWSVRALEDFGSVNPATAVPNSLLVVNHTLGTTPRFGSASVTAPGYNVGFREATPTTVTFWIRDVTGADVTGGVFILFWEVRA